MMLSNLGNVLLSLGEREGGTARIEEAVAAYRASLEERTRERVPLAWARTQNNLGSALKALGKRESGTARLEEAVSAYRAAVQEQTRERAPLEWATATGNQGIVMVVIAERTKDVVLAEEALRHIEVAYEVAQSGNHAPLAAYFEEQLTKAQAIREQLKGK